MLQALLVFIASTVGLIVCHEIGWQGPKLTLLVIGLTAAVWLAGAIVSKLVRAGRRAARVTPESLATAAGRTAARAGAMKAVQSRPKHDHMKSTTRSV